LTVANKVEVSAFPSHGSTDIRTGQWFGVCRMFAEIHNSPSSQAGGPSIAMIDASDQAK
jgi:hypothetical protein